MIKPSELAPTVSSLIAELLPKYLDNDLFHVVNGDIPVTTRALELKWDHSTYHAIVMCLSSPDPSRKFCTQVSHDASTSRYASKIPRRPCSRGTNHCYGSC